MPDATTNTCQNTKEKQKPRIFYSDCKLVINGPLGPQMGISWVTERLNGWSLLKDTFGEYFVVKGEQKIKIFSYQAMALIDVLYMNKSLNETDLDFMK